MTRRYITGIFATIHPIHPIHPIEPIEPIEPIHPIHTVSVQPFSVMTHWRVFQVRGPLGSRSRHLVGRAGGEGRVCTALTSLTAVSGSGRFYRLEGQPGQDPDATYVWEQ